MGPITVGAGIGVADQILSFFGISPTSIGAKILGAGGDKKKRLEKIEMLANVTALYTANMMRAAEAAPPETASAIKDGVILQLGQALAEIIKAADLDGSSNPS